MSSCLEMDVLGNTQKGSKEEFPGVIKSSTHEEVIDRHSDRNKEGRKDKVVLCAAGSRIPKSQLLFSSQKLRKTKFNKNKIKNKCKEGSDDLINERYGIFSVGLGVVEALKGSFVLRYLP